MLSSLYPLLHFSQPPPTLHRSLFLPLLYLLFHLHLTLFSFLFSFRLAIVLSSLLYLTIHFPLSLYPSIGGWFSLYTSPSSCLSCLFPSASDSVYYSNSFLFFNIIQKKVNIVLAFLRNRMSCKLFIWLLLFFLLNFLNLKKNASYFYPPYLIFLFEKCLQ